MRFSAVCLPICMYISFTAAKPDTHDFFTHLQDQDIKWDVNYIKYNDHDSSISDPERAKTWKETNIGTIGWQNEVVQNPRKELPTSISKPMRQKLPTGLGGWGPLGRKSSKTSKTPYGIPPSRGTEASNWKRTDYSTQLIRRSAILPGPESPPPSPEQPSQQPPRNELTKVSSTTLKSFTNRLEQIDAEFSQRESEERERQRQLEQQQKQQFQSPSGEGLRGKSSESQRSGSQTHSPRPWLNLQLSKLGSQGSQPLTPTSKRQDSPRLGQKSGQWIPSPRHRDSPGQKMRGLLPLFPSLQRQGSSSRGKQGLEHSPPTPRPWDPSKQTSPQQQQQQLKGKKTQQQQSLLRQETVRLDQQPQKGAKQQKTIQGQQSPKGQGSLRPPQSPKARQSPKQPESKKGQGSRQSRPKQQKKTERYRQRRQDRPKHTQPARRLWTSFLDCSAMTCKGPMKRAQSRSPPTRPPSPMSPNLETQKRPHSLLSSLTLSPQSKKSHR